MNDNDKCNSKNNDIIIMIKIMIIIIKLMIINNTKPYIHTYI